MSKRLIAALDSPDLEHVQKLAGLLAPSCGLLKLGLEFFLAHGPPGVRAITDLPIFLDLKLHDIPNTVAGAVRAVLPLAPAMLTLHAAGGRAMIEAARKAADSVAHPPKLLAVTVLTSLDAAALQSIGVHHSPATQVHALAQLALQAGADGLVCSAWEVASLRRAFGPDVLLVVPGIRPAGVATGDQARTMTPEEAVAEGADYIVVGRPITAVADPAQAAMAIARSIA